MTTLSAFIRELHEGGRVVVTADGPQPEPAERTLAAARGAAVVAARAAPGRAPEVEDAALLWGFATLYQAVRFLVHRDLGPELLAASFADAGPVATAHRPGTIFAVDVALRHLPALTRRAQALAADDPLLAHLRRLARDWPLSAVGIPAADLGGPPDCAPLLAHPTLAGLYRDRIIAAADTARGADPRLRPLLAAAAAGHPELLPAPLAALLTAPAQPAPAPTVPSVPSFLPPRATP